MTRYVETGYRDGEIFRIPYVAMTPERVEAIKNMMEWYAASANESEQIEVETVLAMLAEAEGGSDGR